MTEPIFNKSSDSYIFTGSQFKAGSNVPTLRLAKGSGTFIDLCQNGIDICSQNVFIRSSNLSVNSLNLIDGANLSVNGRLTSQNLSAGFITASGIAIFNDGLTVASGSLSAVGGTFSGNVNVNGQTTTVRDFVCQNLNVTSAISNASFNNGLIVTNGATSVQGLSATSGTFSSVLTSQNLSAGFITASGLAIFNNGISITNGSLSAVGGTFSSRLTSQNLSAGFITASGIAIFNDGLTVASGSLSAVGGTFSGNVNVNGQTTTVRDFVCQNLNVTSAISNASFSNGLIVTNGATSVQGLTATSGTFSNGLTVNSGDTSVQKLTVVGDLIVRGTTTSINSNTVDISDRSITLAAGNTLSRLGAHGAGFDICGIGAAFNYNFSNSTSEEKFLSTVGISVSGNILPYNSTSVLPVSYNSFSVNSNRNRTFSNYLGNSTSETELSDYTTDISLLSAKSYVKVDIRVNYIASKEANQTLQFKVKRGLYTASNTLTETNVCLEKVGSDMGVGLIDIYTASVIDRPLVDGRTSLNNRVTYSLHMTRNVLLGDSISDPIGVDEAPLATDTNDVISNYVLLQELYVPP